MHHMLWVVRDERWNRNWNSHICIQHRSQSICHLFIFLRLNQYHTQRHVLRIEMKFLRLRPSPNNFSIPLHLWNGKKYTFSSESNATHDIHHSAFQFEFNWTSERCVRDHLVWSFIITYFGFGLSAVRMCEHAYMTDGRWHDGWMQRVNLMLDIQRRNDWMRAAVASSFYLCRVLRFYHSNFLSFLRRFHMPYDACVICVCSGWMAWNGRWKWTSRAHINNGWKDSNIKTSRNDTTVLLLYSFNHGLPREQCTPIHITWALWSRHHMHICRW